MPGEISEPLLSFFDRGGPALWAILAISLWLWARIGRANEEGQFDEVDVSADWIRPDPWVDLLYPNKYCDFTDQGVLDRLKSGSTDRSGTIDM